MAQETQITETSDASFAADVLQAEIPVLVDFWAPWCGPCRAVAPVLDRLAGAYQDRVKVVKVNVDDCPEVSAALGIRSIPTLALFQGNEILGGIVGAAPEAQIRELIDQHLKT